MPDSGDIVESKTGPLMVRKRLGRGKSGDSYLAECSGEPVVLKIMHDEPCRYYDFGDRNKVLLEVDAYRRLKSCGVRMPALIAADPNRDYLIKEYIDGPVATSMIAEGLITDTIVEQLFGMFQLVKKAHLNIDYFPGNFVYREPHLYYIDYECNPYQPEWDLLNWGIYYWANRDGFRTFLETGDSTAINESPESGIPHKTAVEGIVTAWKDKFL